MRNTTAKTPSTMPTIAPPESPLLYGLSSGIKGPSDGPGDVVVEGGTETVLEGGDTARGGQ